MTELPIRQQGPQVAALQKALQQLGYELPKWGVDGILGFEVLHAVEDFAEDHALDDEVHDDKVSAAMHQAIMDVIGGCVREPVWRAASVEVDFHDITNTHPRKAHRGIRPWKQITGITLHQTGITMSNTMKRFERLRAHVGILSLDRPTIIQVYPYNSRVSHANAFNSTDVGIEFNGCFEGIDGKRNTAWRGGYKDQPDRLSESQIIAGRDAIRRICDEVDGHGGKISRIHAHRQTSGTRRSDPGSRVWQEVGIWAKQELGLSDGGPTFTLRNGLAIPVEWDSSYTESY